MRIILFLLITSNGIAQKSDFKINPDDLFTPGYYSPKPVYFDTIEKIFTVNKLIDSASIEYTSLFNLEVVRKYQPNFHSEGFCFFIDSVYLDSITINKVKRKLVDGPISYGHEYYRLIAPIRISLEYFYYGYTGLRVFQESRLNSKELYFQYEMDKLDSYKFQEIKKDEMGRLWVYMSFNCSRYEGDVSQNPISNSNKTYFQVSGWTLLNFLHIGYDCN